MAANRNMIGDNNKLIRPAHKMYFDNFCDNSVRFEDRLNSSFKCQLFSNGEQGPPATKNINNEKKIIKNNWIGKT